MLKLLFPPVCLHCGTVHDRLKSPLCGTCASSLEIRPAGGSVIITFEGMGPVLSLISSFRKGAAPHLSSVLAAYMVVQYSQSSLSLPDVVTAVPTSRWRKWQVGQESATCLAQEVAKMIGRPFVSLLKRKRQLLRQELLSLEARARLSPEEFQWQQRADLRAKTVLLIDDVVTTGTTLACSAQRLWEASPAQIVKMVCVDQGYL
jgi:competence protein ComFC